MISIYRLQIANSSASRSPFLLFTTLHTLARIYTRPILWCLVDTLTRQLVGDLFWTHRISPLVTVETVLYGHESIQN